ncbi:MAG: hypothetical protein ACXVB9_04590 [Bdellovibrionota bacterium]
MQKIVSILVVSFALAACTHAVQKPQTQWQVKTSTQSEQKIWVTRADGTRQCGKQRPPNPGLVAAQVQGAGVIVFQSRSGTDGQMHAQECGAPTGRTIDLQISRTDIQAVMNLGFVTKDSPSPEAPQAN